MPLNPALEIFTLEAAHAINKENPVEMIDLVLQTSRQESVGLHGKRRAVPVERGDGDGIVALDGIAIIRNAQAALLGSGFTAALGNRGIDQFEPFGTIIGDINNHYALQNSDLRRRQADAGGDDHRLVHIVEQCVQLHIECFLLGAEFFEPRIGIGNDLEHSHTKTVIRYCAAGNILCLPDEHAIIPAMIEFSHSEALLFRMLTSFFGRDHVVPNMSVTSVCGGSLPENIVIDQGIVQLRRRAAGENPALNLGEKRTDLAAWARGARCLFTIVDFNDVPKMVVEFFSGFETAIDMRDLEHQIYLKPILAAAGIRYVTISDAEFADLTDPSGRLDVFTLLRAKFEGLETVHDPE